MAKSWRPWAAHLTANSWTMLKGMGGRRSEGSLTSYPLSSRRGPARASRPEKGKKKEKP